MTRYTYQKLLHKLIRNLIVNAVNGAEGEVGLFLKGSDVLIVKLFPYLI